MLSLGCSIIYPWGIGNRGGEGGGGGGGGGKVRRGIYKSVPGGGDIV